MSHISAHGLWLLAHGKEYFLPHDAFPWFKQARIADILAVEIHHGFHVRWPSLDVDLDLESLDDPGRFPLVYR